jgi:hypothetical protein
MTINIQEIAAAYEAATQEFLHMASTVPADKLDVNDGENWGSCPFQLAPADVCWRSNRNRDLMRINRIHY